MARRLRRAATLLFSSEFRAGGHVLFAGDPGLIADRCWDHVRRTTHFTADDHTVVVEIGGLELIGTLLLIRGDALGTDNDPSTMVAIKTVVSPTGKLLPEA